MYSLAGIAPPPAPKKATPGGGAQADGAGAENEEIGEGAEFEAAAKASNSGVEAAALLTSATLPKHQAEVLDAWAARPLEKTARSQLVECDLEVGRATTVRDPRHCWRWRATSYQYSRWRVARKRIARPDLAKRRNDSTKRKNALRLEADRLVFSPSFFFSTFVVFVVFVRLVGWVTIRSS